MENVKFELTSKQKKEVGFDKIVKLDDECKVNEANALELFLVAFLIRVTTFSKAIQGAHNWYLDNLSKKVKVDTTDTKKYPSGKRPITIEDFSECFNGLKKSQFTKYSRIAKYHTMTRYNAYLKKSHDSDLECFNVNVSNYDKYLSAIAKELRDKKRLSEQTKAKEQVDSIELGSTSPSLINSTPSDEQIDKQAIENALEVLTKKDEAKTKGKPKEDKTDFSFEIIQGKPLHTGRLTEKRVQMFIDYVNESTNFKIGFVNAELSA